MISARGRRLAARFVALQERHEPRLARALAQFLRAQAGRVVARYLDAAGQRKTTEPAGDPLSADALLPKEEERRLLLLLRPYLVAESLASSDLAGDLVGLDGLVDTDPRLVELLGQAEARGLEITETTREAIREVLVEGARRHYSPYQIAHGNEKESFRGLADVVGETYQGRVDAIARTELAIASQRAAHERYRAAGVTKVAITDGTECGWTYHEDPDLADGSTRTLAEAEAYPIAHPRCRRVSMPILESRG